MMRSIFGLLLLISISSAEYIRDNVNETVLDTSTHIIWQDNNETTGTASKKTWTDAISYCENLDLAGKSDWRVPSIHEQYMLANRSIHSPSLSTVFQNVASITADAEYWSSTSYGSGSARYIEFNYGGSAMKTTTDLANISCIRAGVE